LSNWPGDKLPGPWIGPIPERSEQETILARFQTDGVSIRSQINAMPLGRKGPQPGADSRAQGGLVVERGGHEDLSGQAMFKFLPARSSQTAG